MGTPFLNLTFKLKTEKTAFIEANGKTNQLPEFVTAEMGLFPSFVSVRKVFFRHSPSQPFSCILWNFCKVYSKFPFHILKQC